MAVSPGLMLSWAPQLGQLREWISMCVYREEYEGREGRGGKEEKRCRGELFYEFVIFGVGSDPKP